MSPPIHTHTKTLTHRWLHITSEGAEGQQRRVLRLVLALPKPGQMDAIAPLVALMPLLVDLVGRLLVDCWWIVSRLWVDCQYSCDILACVVLA